MWLTLECNVPNGGAVKYLALFWQTNLEKLVEGCLISEKVMVVEGGPAHD